MMNTNMKFERAARRRKYFAFWAAILLHVAVIAAISSQEDLMSLLPDFIKELIGKSAGDVPIAGLE